MKKFIGFLYFTFFICGYCYSQDAEITVRVTNIAVNGGKVYLALFTNAVSFKVEQPEYVYELPNTSATATQVISVPPGEYVVSVFQDANNNQKMDYNFLGIPKELVGVSTYSGKGFPPRDFDKLKIKLDNTTGMLTMPLYKF